MKAFRGTLVTAVLVVVVAIIVAVLRPDLLSSSPETEPRLFEFEKHELVRVEVRRPDAEQIALVEEDGRWTIEGTDFVAGRSMVNRIKHQIHDLTARATVVVDPELPELYGLGEHAIEVHLFLRDGRELEFLAGDPNPSSVSYYLRRSHDQVIYTVKKSAVDYYSLTLDEFRERRFASFDSKDTTRIEAVVTVDESLERRTSPMKLVLERTGDREWEMRSPVQMSASDDQVRRLMGRVSALKARDFEVMDPGDGLEPFGLDAPRLDVSLEFSSREPLRILVGADAPTENRYEELAYVQIVGDDTVYVAKRGLLEEFGGDPTELRNRRVVRMKSEDVVGVDVVLRSEPDEPQEGEAGVRYAVEQWVWKDGVPVPGSTPKRVARHLAELEVDAFVDDEPGELSQYGLDEPVARAVLSDAEGNERVVLIGDRGDPEIIDPMPRPGMQDNPGPQERPRRFVAVEGSAPVYLVDERCLSVIRDMIREYNRKAVKDEARASRRERIESVLVEEEP